MTKMAHYLFQSFFFFPPFGFPALGKRLSPALLDRSRPLPLPPSQESYKAAPLPHGPPVRLLRSLKNPPPNALTCHSRGLPWLTPSSFIGFCDTSRTSFLSFEKLLGRNGLLLRRLGLHSCVRLLTIPLSLCVGTEFPQRFLLA